MTIELSDQELRFIQGCIEVAVDEGLPGLHGYGNLTGAEQNALFDRLGLQEKTWIYKEVNES